MFFSFLSRKAHPLADPQEARQVAARLASAEPVAALDEIAAWGASVMADPQLRPAEKGGLLHTLAGMAQPHLTLIADDFHQAAGLRLQPPPHKWRAARDYCQARFQNLAALLEALERDGKALPEPVQARLIAQLVRAGADALKWERFHYGGADAPAWACLGRAYQMARQRQVHGQAVRLEGGATTVRREFLRALALEASALDCLLPPQMELADRLIGRFVGSFLLTGTAKGQSTHWIDLSALAAPRRVALHPEPSPHLRFFSAVPALEPLAELRCQFELGGLPQELGLSGVLADPEVVRPTFRHLLTYWSCTAPMRRHRRYGAGAASLDVVGGLHQVHSRLCGNALAGANAGQGWTLTDVSRGGAGLDAPPATEWLRVGSLIGLQPNQDGDWMVGVVRRLRRQPDQRAHIGVQALSPRAVPLVADIGGNRVDALLLDAPQANGDVRVVLQIAAYRAATPLHFRVRGESLRVEPLELLESGPDYEVGRYRVAA